MAAHQAKALSHALGELYAAPLGEFVAVRARLAAALEDAGEKDAAAAVKRAAKPAAPVWALNVVARRRGDALRAAVDAGDEVRAAYRRGGDAVREATATWRAAIGEVVAAAEAVLVEGGHAVTAAMLRRVERTLEATPFVDDDARDALLAGVLAEALEQPEDALTLLASGMPANAERRRVAAAPDEQKERERERERRERERREARAAAESEARRAAQKAEAAEARLATASGELERAEEALARAEARAGEARATRDEAEAAAVEARAALRQAKERLQRLR